jgi:hypothetical protein
VKYFRLPSPVLITQIVPGSPINRIRGASAVGAALLIILLSSCSRQSDITVYRLPKESAAPAPDAATEGGTAAASLHWTAPAGWQEQPATGFRKGSFLVPGPGGQADVSVVSFPNEAGGLLGNVNRWRDQLHLAPITEDDLKTAVTTIPVAGLTIPLVDLVSTQPMLEGGLKSRILGAILSLPNETWFFKMSGPDAIVESQLDSFKQFLQSLQIDGMDDGSAAPFAGTNPPASAPTDTQPASSLQYDLPPGWQEKPLTPMRVASFNIPGGAEGDADASIVVLSGTAEGELSNINRWRSQIGLGPVSAAALNSLTTHLEANGHDYLLVDLIGTQPAMAQKSKARILVAMLSENNQSWFIKMIGPDKVVAAQRDAFLGLVKNLRIPL